MTMSKTLKIQRGGSAVGNIIFLAILAYAVYVGLQWVPQLIESSNIDGILDSINENYRVDNDTGIEGIQAAISKQLSINEALDMQDRFTVTQHGNSYLISVTYERELNLLFGKKVLMYQKTVSLP